MQTCLPEHALTARPEHNFLHTRWRPQNCTLDGCMVALTEWAMAQEVKTAELAPFGLQVFLHR